MAGRFAINISGDVEGAVIQAQALFTAVEDIGLAIKATAKVYQRMAHTSFATESDPDGGRWKQLAEATIKTRRALGYEDGPILERTHHLYNSVTSTFDTMYLATGAATRSYFLDIRAMSPRGTNYAPPHLYGSPIWNTSTELPARPYLPGQIRMTGVLREIAEGFIADVVNTDSNVSQAMTYSEFQSISYGG